ncbi:PAN2-PAN3 deadenylation complex catalytic subunit PAN2 isoform X3 [Tetranychus urticae]|nr:PAN2-PAN3 deadenylation complex catalytic subunit PAN2 isoform X3 [Tetranychus urticae]
MMSSVGLMSTMSGASSTKLPMVINAPPGGEYAFLSTVISDFGSNVSTQLGVSALAFDNMEELLWMGNTGSHVTSYYGYTLQKYTSFQVHSVNDIRSLLTADFGLLSLTQNTLRLNIRRGLTLFTHSSELLKDMQAMTILPSGLVLIGGQQKQLIEFDLERIKQVRITDIEEDGCVIIRKHPKFVCCGDIAGKITLRDPNSLKIAHSFSTHSVTLSDFDVHGNYLVSCGYSNRHLYVPDRFLMVYDLRMMRAIMPIQMVFSPYLLRFVPAFSSRFCVVSQTGQFQLLDASASLQTPFIQNVDLATGTSITSFDISNSGQALAFADDAGIIYLYGASDEVVFNNFSQPTEFADPVDPARPLSFNDIITPYSINPMPAYRDDKLLADIPAELCKKAYRLPKPIDPAILSNMRMVGNICYAPNPGAKGRNQMPYASPENTKGSKNKSNTSSSEIPSRYLTIEPNYNKVSLDEYDFGRHNHSPFASLDSTLPNSYANNLIQTLYYILPLRATVLNHLCRREFCLTCELAFLFHMIDESSFQNPCQATNFLRAFRQMPKASALTLVLPEDDDLRRKVNFPSLAQSWWRFILHQLHSELSSPDATTYNKESPSTSIITELFGIHEKSSYTCKCGHAWEEEKMKYPTTLLHPDNSKYNNFNKEDKAPTNNELQNENYPFQELLKKSLNMEQNMSAYCDKCNKFQYVAQKRQIESLPDILSINSALDQEKGLKFWKAQVAILGGNNGPNKLLDLAPAKKPCRYGNKCTRADCKFCHEKDKCSIVPPQEINMPYLPMKMFMKLDVDGKLDILVEKNPDDSDDSYIEYGLMTVVSVVRKPDELGKDNIVAIIKVDGDYFKLKSKEEIPDKDNWYLFNHFCISPIPTDEVVHMDFNWKTPVMIMYSRMDLLKKYENKLKIVNPITAEVFQDDRNLARGHRSSITFTPLSADEMPKKGNIVAVDAEFVTLNQAETEFRSDGTRATIKPPQRSVARITCIRGSGLLEGQPFLDDYIATQDQVADYMTKFSGIQPGDLDITMSSKHLTTLKSTYLKLRFLIDTGVVFVGHGLKNDFRVINLVVPQDQVIDTVLLFQSPHFKRMVSLRFLAWHFLGEKIQSETHDSIEDAKTALQLYRKFEELKSLRRVESSVNELYDAGRNCGWKLPGTEEE